MEDQDVLDSLLPSNENTSTGTFVEGVGDEVVVACMMILIFAVTYLSLRWMNDSSLTAIHPDSQENVNEARSQLGIDSHGSTDSNFSEENGNETRHFFTDCRCPICLVDATYPIETNCGHLFCGHCIITYWRFGNWLGAVNCPVCRQNVTLLMCLHSSSNNTENEQVIRSSINEYNRRFSGEPRAVMDYIRDLPVLLRHLWREFFSVGGLLFMFRIRIILCIFLVVIYLLSPLDILPEAVLGFLGLLDDFFIILLVLVYVTIIYRQVVAERNV